MYYISDNIILLKCNIGLLYNYIIYKLNLFYYYLILLFHYFTIV